LAALPYCQRQYPLHINDHLSSTLWRHFIQREFATLATTKAKELARLDLCNSVYPGAVHWKSVYHEMRHIQMVVNVQAAVLHRRSVWQPRRYPRNPQLVMKPLVLPRSTRELLNDVCEKAQRLQLTHRIIREPTAASLLSRQASDFIGMDIFKQVRFMTPTPSAPSPRRRTSQRRAAGIFADNAIILTDDEQT
jgi:hypothetical protein